MRKIAEIYVKAVILIKFPHITHLVLKENCIKVMCLVGPDQYIVSQTWSADIGLVQIDRYWRMCSPIYTNINDFFGAGKNARTRDLKLCNCVASPAEGGSLVNN